MSPRPLAVSAPPRVADRLRATPDGVVPLLHRARHAVYVDVPGGCVGVVEPAAAQVPCALRTAPGGLGGLPLRSAEVRGGVLNLDGHPLVVGRLERVAVPRTAPAPVPAQWDPADLAALVGAGEGLTPYGDDVVCGWLAAHRSAGLPTPEADAQVRALLHRTTTLSATLVECALHGEALPELGAWLRARGTDAEPAARHALTAVGHTSGRGLLAGARMALHGMGLSAEEAA